MSEARAPHVPVSFAVEGDIDDTVVRSLAEQLRVGVHEVFVRNGKPNLLKALPGFNASARSRPWFVLVDLDRDAPCAPPYVAEHLPKPSDLMRFRVAIRSIEAGLLADRRGFARFFGIRIDVLPADPESLPDAKQTIVELARGSNKKIVRQGLPPRPGSGRRTGELYSSLLMEFASKHWNVGAARERSPSLDKAARRLPEIAAPA